MVDFPPSPPPPIIISQVTPVRPLKLSSSHAVAAGEITTAHLPTRHEIEWCVPEIIMALSFYNDNIKCTFFSVDESELTGIARKAIFIFRCVRKIAKRDF
jgi:hypothetical protein